jgi:hypothetical protein
MNWTEIPHELTDVFVIENEEELLALFTAILQEERERSKALNEHIARQERDMRLSRWVMRVALFTLILSCGVIVVSGLVG